MTVLPHDLRILLKNLSSLLHRIQIPVVGNARRGRLIAKNIEWDR
jgi:hypothetical protein